MRASAKRSDSLSPRPRRILHAGIPKLIQARQRPPVGIRHGPGLVELRAVAGAQGPQPELGISIGAVKSRLHQARTALLPAADPPASPLRPATPMRDYEARIAVFHASSRRDSRSHPTIRVIRRNRNSAAHSRGWDSRHTQLAHAQDRTAALAANPREVCWHYET
jgi:hypothetical protein